MDGGRKNAFWEEKGNFFQSNRTSIGVSVGPESPCVSRSNIFHSGVKRNPFGPQLENDSFSEVKRMTSERLIISNLQKSDFFSSIMDNLSTETQKSAQTQFHGNQKSKKSLQIQRPSAHNKMFLLPSHSNQKHSQRTVTHGKLQSDRAPQPIL